MADVFGAGSQAPTITLESGVRKQVDKAFLDAKLYRAENSRTASKGGVGMQ